MPRPQGKEEKQVKQVKKDKKLQSAKSPSSAKSVENNKVVKASTKNVETKTLNPVAKPKGAVLSKAPTTSQAKSVAKAQSKMPSQLAAKAVSHVTSQLSVKSVAKVSSSLIQSKLKPQTKSASSMAAQPNLKAQPLQQKTTGLSSPAALTEIAPKISIEVKVESKPEIRPASKSIRDKINEKMREKRSANLQAMGPVDFKVGDHAVYPSYGVGTVVAIETKEIMGSRCDFYVVIIRDTGMKVMVPKNNVSSVGLRPVISKQEATKVLDILRTTEVRIDNQTWNRRYREYMEKIKTGSVYEIAEVLRDLFLLKVDKELSYGERNMLDTARKLLMRELTLAFDQEELAKEDGVRQIFGL